MDTTQATPRDIDEYIAGFPREVQELLQQIRTTVRNAAPDAEEAIKYQMPTFVLHGKNLVHFAAYKNHIGFYADAIGIDTGDRGCEGGGGSGQVKRTVNQPF